MGPTVAAFGPRHAPQTDFIVGIAFDEHPSFLRQFLELDPLARK